MANGTLKVQNIETSSGSGTITLGQSGETVTVPNGVTVSGLMSNTPSFSVQRSTAQSLANNTTTTVLFNSINHDTDNAYSSSSGEFTVPANKAGKYFFCGHVRIDTTTDSSRLTSILLVNGNVKATVNNVQRDEDSTNFSLVIDLNVGDQVKYGIFQNTGGAKNTKTADNVMFMGFKLLG